VKVKLDRAFRSRLRSVALTARLGRWLGVAFAVCFVTGLLSHAIQHPPGWFWWPSRPVALYRITQGLHVATGLACVPLLSAKLWSVYPRLFAWPPFRNLGHALERAGIALLVSAALFELVTGLLNIALWYSPMPFGFIAAHYWTAWLAIGGLLLHVAVKRPVIRDALARRADPPPAPQTGLSRRGVLTAVAATAGLVTIATVGQTVRPLGHVSPLAPRRPDLGPQGVPVNTSAAAAGVAVAALDPGYRLAVTGPAGRIELSLAELSSLANRTADLPITCVEGWSSGAEWTGVPVRDLLARVGVPDGDATVLVESLQAGGAYRTSILAPPHARDPLTLLAVRLRGQPLHLDHGYPCRLIAPNRPGVMQTKWVHAITVMAP
jgi:DMSO/TMAO reductase YedYZ molybdopterin-dependent catalytic subunit